jgi:uncharacterized protein (TIGR00255 family)
MTKSMTGFASARGEGHGFAWAWEIRAVNSRGLDIRLRLPDWIEGLEAALRPMVQGAVARGAVTVSLKLQREAGAEAPLAPEPELLHRVLATLKVIEQEAAAGHGLRLAPTSAAEILDLRVLTAETARPEADSAALRSALTGEFSALLEAFDTMRAAEGAALARVIGAQLDTIAGLVERAAEAAEARKEAMAQTLRENLARVLDNSQGADPDRVAQELALIAVKADVTEEIDRLRAHVDAARTLLEADGPAGRKLDFLTQEFNREANTLCAKAQSVELTRIGLDLKAVIDQMREQVQNVE